MVTVEIRPSTINPTQALICIYGDSIEEVQNEVWSHNGTFTLPVKTGDGKWAVVGHLFGEIKL